MQWCNLSKLIIKIEKFIDTNDYFMFCTENAKHKEELEEETKTKESPQFLMEANIMLQQRGCVRTNCMDCLDRTNVVQSVISRNILLKQLKKFNLLKDFVIEKKDPFLPFPGSLEEAFRELWTNHANQLSILYSGTCAMKTDFTLTGKRTIKGALNDGVCGVKRYVINTFLDGYYQDCLDMVSGYLKPQEIKSTTTTLKKAVGLGLWVCG